MLRRLRDSANRPVLFTAAVWLLVGIVQLVQLQGDPFFHEPAGDAGWFVEHGHRIADGNGLAARPLFYSPAMPLLHSVFFRIFGDSIADPPRRAGHENPLSVHFDHRHSPISPRSDTGSF